MWVHTNTKTADAAKITFYWKAAATLVLARPLSFFTLRFYIHNNTQKQESSKKQRTVLWHCCGIQIKEFWQEFWLLVQFVINWREKVTLWSRLTLCRTLYKVAQPFQHCLHESCSWAGDREWTSAAVPCEAPQVPCWTPREGGGRKMRKKVGGGGREEEEEKRGRVGEKKKNSRELGGGGSKWQKVIPKVWQYSSL